MAEPQTADEFAKARKPKGTPAEFDDILASGALKNWDEGLAKEAAKKPNASKQAGLLLGGSMGSNFTKADGGVKNQYIDSLLGDGTYQKAAGLAAEGLGQGQYGENNPMAGQRYLDEDSQGILDKRTESLLKGSPDDYDGLNPVFGSNPKSLATQGAQGAMEERAKKDFDRGLGRLKRDAAFNKPVEESAKIAKTNSLLASNEQLRIQNYKEQAAYVTQVKQHNENLAAMKSANKKSLLGTILGGIGSVIGTVATGGLGGIIGGAIGAGVGSKK